MTPTAELVPVTLDTKELTVKVQTLSERGLAIRVVDDASLIEADRFISDALAMENEIKAFFKDSKKRWSDGHKAECAREAAELAKVTPGKEHARTEKNAYELEQRRKREAEEARLLKEAQEREEAERLERAAEIEREALRLKQSGQVEEAAAVQQEAEQVMNTPAFVPAPRMAPVPRTKNAMKMIVDRDRLQTVVDGLNRKTIKTPPQIPGVTFSQEWKFEVFSPSAVPESWRKPS